MSRLESEHTESAPSARMRAGLRKASLAGALALILAGGFVLAGWTFDVEGVRLLHPHMTPMNPATAVCFLLCGFILLGSLPIREVSWTKRAVRCAAWLVLTMGLVRSAECALGFESGIDLLLFPAKVAWGAVRPVRLAPNTAMGFVIAGLAFLFLKYRTRGGRSPAEYLGGILGIISLYPIVGYLYGVEFLYDPTATMPMALNTAISFSILAAAILISRPDGNVVTILSSASAGGVAARWLLPAVLIVMPLLGWLGLAGQRRGMFAGEIGVALSVVTMITILTALIGVLCVALDKADQHRAATAVRALEQKELFHSVLENVADGIVVAGRDGRFLHWNPAATRILGRGLADISSELWSEHYRLYLPDGRTLFPADRLPLVRAIRGEIADDVELIVRSDQFPASRWVQISGRPVVDRGGHSIGGVVLFRDITTQKEAVETIRKARDELEHRVEERTAELARSNMELDQFAYIASHDLQQPLRMVTSYVQLLARRYGDLVDAEGREFIQYAVEGATRMKGLISDLLAFSRVGTCGRPLEPVDAELVLRHTIKLLEVAIRESGARITHDAMPTVMADESQLVRLFQNLLDNAIKYRGETPSEIHISVEKDDGHWRFAIRDNGIGIPPEYAERIFLMFQRLHGKDKYSGTGIGLAVCKKVVERHGGRIWVEPNAGGGSTFHFTIPGTESAVQIDQARRTRDRVLVGEPA